MDVVFSATQARQLSATIDYANRVYDAKPFVMKYVIQQIKQAIDTEQDFALVHVPKYIYHCHAYNHKRMCNAIVDELEQLQFVVKTSSIYGSRPEDALQIYWSDAQVCKTNEPPVFIKVKDEPIDNYIDLTSEPSSMDQQLVSNRQEDTIFDESQNDDAQESATQTMSNDQGNQDTENRQHSRCCMIS